MFNIKSGQLTMIRFVVALKRNYKLEKIFIKIIRPDII